MKKRLKNIGFIIGLFSLIFIACEDNIDPIIEELEFDRVFASTDISVRIRNKTTAEITWAVRDDADHYVLEISEDSMEFNSIVITKEVAPNEIPISIQLDGETRYSVRVKGVSSGIGDSKWIGLAFYTDAENIFSTIADGDIGATTATLRWPAGSEVTHFTIMPDNINREITDQEKADGVATITGLTGETQYTVLLFKNTKQRGLATFTTLVDIGNATPLYPEDDLNAIILAAQEGDEFVLFPGDYTVYSGQIIINKSISIKGIYPFDKPIVYVQFMLEDGVQNVVVADLSMNGSYVDSTGTAVSLDYAFKYNTDNVVYGNLSVNGCIISNYKKSLLSTGSFAFSAESVLVNNCIVSNVITDGGDFIDFRMSHVGSLKVTNSTFNNCATVNARDFIRMDGSSKGNIYDDGTRTPEIEVSNCTLYNVMNAEALKRFFYVRWSQHTIKSKNNLLVNMGASVYSNQSLTMQPECSNNNYFNADGYFTEAAGMLIDNSGNYSTLDPGFANPENGDFTVTNQTILDNSVGDPRWLVGL